MVGGGVALGSTVGDCGVNVGGADASRASGVAVCAGALPCPELVEAGGAGGATTGDTMDVLVGRGEAVGVVVMICATYGGAVAGGAVGGGSVAVAVAVGDGTGLAVGDGVGLAVGVAVAGRQISASVRSGGWAPCPTLLSPQAQPFTSPLCTSVPLAPICENCQ